MGRRRSHHRVLRGHVGRRHLHLQVSISHYPLFFQPAINLLLFALFSRRKKARAALVARPPRPPPPSSGPS